MFAVWVDNEKKEKEVATGKSSNAEEDLGYWNLAENRISDIDVADELHSDKNKLTEPKYVGTENTPSVADKRRKPTESSANRDTVDAEVINDEETDSVDDDGLPEESNLELRDHNNGDSDNENDNSQFIKDDYDEEESDKGSHDGRTVSDEATSIVEGTPQNIRAENGDASNEDLSVLSEVGQGKSHVEKPKKPSRRKKAGRKRVSKGKYSGKKNLHKKFLKKKVVPSLIDSGSGAKENSKTVVEINDDIDKAEKLAQSDIDNASKMWYDGSEVKRDDISRLQPLEYEEGALKDKMGSYAPDDGDISEIVSRFTDHKQENMHRMGNDELQMHLDDEALKMQVKAIEEEDSNVKNVLQGSERFANEQKLGHLEGDFEKDLIRNIGKDGVNLDVGELGKHRHEGHHESKSFVELEDKNKDQDDEKEDENEREGYKERFESKDKDEGEDEDEEEDDDNPKSNRSSDRKWDDDDKDDDEDENGRNGDESGERKNIVRNSSENGNPKKNHGRAKKYNFFTPTGKLGGDISPTEEAEMGVNIDNQAMESEIKEIENEDAKVSSALEGMNKAPGKVELDEYNYDSADASISSKLNHHKFGVDLTDSNSDGEGRIDQADLKHVVSQTESVKGGSQISDDLRDMLRETSKILNETNAVLNEGHAIAQKSHEILNSTKHYKQSEGNETNSLSGNNSAQNETVSNGLTSSAGNWSANTTFPIKVDPAYNQGNNTNATKSISEQTTPNGNSTHKDANEGGNDSNVNTPNSFFASKEEFILKGVPNTSSKRVLKRNDDYESRTAYKVRKRVGKSSWRRNGKSYRKHGKQKLKSFFAEDKEIARKPVNNKYTKNELNILNLMYKSPALKGMRGKASKVRFQQADKRSYTPNKKITYRRFRKGKLNHKKGIFTKKRITEAGKKRGDVEEGMTGGE